MLHHKIPNDHAMARDWHYAHVVDVRASKSQRLLPTVATWNETSNATPTSEMSAFKSIFFLRRILPGQGGPGQWPLMSLVAHGRLVGPSSFERGTPSKPSPAELAPSEYKYLRNGIIGKSREIDEKYKLQMSGAGVGCRCRLLLLGLNMAYFAVSLVKPVLY